MEVVKPGTDQGKLTARHNIALIVHHADGPVDGILHLSDHTLENSTGHNRSLLCVMAKIPYSRIFSFSMIPHYFGIFNRNSNVFLLIFFVLSLLRSNYGKPRAVFFGYLPMNTLHKSVSVNSRKPPGGRAESRLSPPTARRRSASTGFPREASIRLTWWYLPSITTT